MYSRTVFTIDDDVVVVAPGSSEAVSVDVDVTVVGRVLRFGRPPWSSALPHATLSKGDAMKLDSLEKLYVHELKDLHSAETQLLEALPKMEAAATDPELKAAFANHLKETKTHVRRLDELFRSMNFQPGGHRCAAMAGLIDEGKELISSDAEPRVLDAGLAAAAQRVEHYEMAGYGTARSYAEKLGRQSDADTLQVTLNEEGLCDQTLTRLAERRLNFLAMTGNGASAAS